jgi:glycosyltransferase involved in cell wall biosynthesis
MTRPSTGPRPRVLIAHPGAELYGSDRVMLESAAALVRSGAHVTVAVPCTGPLVLALERCGAAVVLCPTPVLRKSVLRPTGALHFAGLALRGFGAGRRLLRRVRPDVVYVNTVTIPLWALLARLSGLPVVTHIHEAETTTPLPVRRALAAPLLLSHTLISNSDHCVDVVSAVFPELRERARVIRNPIAWPEHPAASRPDLEGGLHVLYLGRLSERKGVDVAVRAVAQLRASGCRAELDIVGAVFAGYEWYLDELHELVTLLRLDSAAHFHGYCADVWPRLAGCDVVVVPSRLDEGFGNTAVEGILAARPVIVSDTSGLREAAAGFASAQRVPPGGIAGWTAALDRVRTGWTGFRVAAGVDQQLARRRHAGAGYQAGIADAIQQTVLASVRAANHQDLRLSHWTSSVSATMRGERRGTD